MADDMPAPIKAKPRAHAKKCVSPRGPFEIFTNTKINPPGPRRKVDPEAAAAYFEHSALAEKHGEEPVRQKIAEMVESIQGGSAVTVLFSQKGPGGMTLVHAWFGPNFPLFAHSHPRYGDCLYYVVAGEAILGTQRLGPGAGFFVPNGHPYKYTAGPAGVEILEFRAGGGEPDAPGMKLDERALSSIQDLINRAKANQDGWQAPENIGDTAFRQAALSAE
jgi:hypothetical protein